MRHGDEPTSFHPDRIMLLLYFNVPSMILPAHNNSHALSLARLHQVAAAVEEKEGTWMPVEEEKAEKEAAAMVAVLLARIVLLTTVVHRHKEGSIRSMS